MERKISEVFEYEKVMLEVVERADCDRCYFMGKNCVKEEVYRIIGPCSSSGRTDNKSVQFHINNLPLNFWKRLKLFIENTQVNDMPSEEEKSMIINECNKHLI